MKQQQARMKSVQRSWRPSNTRKSHVVAACWIISFPLYICALHFVFNEICVYQFHFQGKDDKRRIRIVFYVQLPYTLSMEGQNKFAQFPNTYPRSCNLVSPRFPTSFVILHCQKLKIWADFMFLDALASLDFTLVSK